MAYTTCVYFVALLFTARCNPLGQTEASGVVSNILPNVPSTTVCETSPNLLGLGLGYGSLGLNIPSPLGLLSPYGLPLAGVGSNTVCDTKANVGGLPLLSAYGLPLPGMGSTTVCDSKPNVGGLPLLSAYGLPLPGMGSTTACDTKPNIGGLLSAYGLPGSTTICENAPNIPYPLTRGLSGSTTIYENSPNVLTPFGLQGLATTVCDTTPNLGPYILPQYGLPFSRVGVNKCETVPNVLPFGGLGLPYGLPLNGLTVSPLGLPLL